MSKKKRLCPKCEQPLPPRAAMCHRSECHEYFDRRALIWFQRDEIKARAERWEVEKALEEEEKARKKAAKEAKKEAGAG